jgi:hypothetical protein
MTVCRKSSATTAKATRAQIAVEIDRLVDRMHRDRSARGPAPPASPVEAPPGEDADPIAPPSAP